MPSHESDLPRLGIAYDVTSSAPMELAALLSGVCRPVWIVDRADPALGPLGRVLGRLGDVVDTSGSGPESVADAVRSAGVEGVVAFTDSQLAAASALAEALSLPGNDAACVARLTDKWSQRSALAHAGLPTPRFVLLPPGAGRAEVDLALADIGFPAVLKPVRGDSSSDVVTVHGPADVAADVAVARIVEEYLADRDDLLGAGLGSYVSAEVVVVDGSPTVSVLTGKFPLAPPFRERGNFLPHPLHADDAAAVMEVAVNASRALGVASGALHVEVKMTPDGPRVIEVNGRIGGGAIDLLHRAHTGRSLTEIAALVALGRAPAVTAEVPAEHAGPFRYQFFLQPPVEATSLVGMAVGDAVIGVAGADDVAPNRSAGDALDWRRGSQGYVVRVGGTAADRTALSAVPEALTAAVSPTYGTTVA